MTMPVIVSAIQLFVPMVFTFIERYEQFSKPKYELYVHMFRWVGFLSFQIVSFKKSKEDAFFKKHQIYQTASIQAHNNWDKLAPILEWHHAEEQRLGHGELCPLFCYLEREVGVFAPCLSAQMQLEG